jgi:hypothetical protein
MVVMSGGYKWRYYNIGTYAFEGMVGRSLKPTLYSISSGPNYLPSLYIFREELRVALTL